jgi:hypothetical protein
MNEKWNKKWAVKNLLGELPLTAEIYWQLFQHGRPVTRSFSLRKTQKRLPEWCAQAKQAVSEIPSGKGAGKRILLFCTLRYWIEHAALLGVALAGLGHRVTLAYLPYPSWNRPLSRFDLRRHNAYAREALKASSDLVQPLSLLDVRRASQESLPSKLVQAIEEVSLRDTQYTLQIEEVETENPRSPSGHLYHLRQERNLQAAAALYGWIHSLKPDQRPEVLLTPNGSILEMGAIYQSAHCLGIPAVTYEFGEQRGRIWLAQDSEVMLQETNDLWEARQNIPLTESQWEQIRALYASRQNGKLWENFARLWQGLPSQGGKKVRQELGLDERPIVLLAANVIGDSLTLGRQIFTRNMTEWLEKNLNFFANRPDAQFLVRIHPGERYLKGPSVAEIARNALPRIPEHIRLIDAQAPVNTYDLVEIADLGLAYTTTVGMEMAMSGVPVVLGGQTHYRAKGFTHDPTSWDGFFESVDRVLQAPGEHRLSREQVERAWNYAYRFFFEFPEPFPWHLLSYWDELETWPVERVLSGEGREAFGATFNCLAGAPRQWSIADWERSEVK